MARKKTIKKTPVILRNALSVYERSITRFSDVVCQFTVQNGNQISYDILEVSPDPDPTPRVERSITRFKEVVCEFVVIDGTDVHAYELEPVYADITGGGTTYTITNNLTNVSNSNAAASIGDGDPYNATLTAAAGYAIDSVVITMGGVDVTASAYDNGDISIAAVTGNIVITASASVAAYNIITVDQNYTNAGTVSTYFRGLMPLNQCCLFLWIRGDAATVPTDKMIYYCGDSNGNIRAARFHNGHIADLSTFTSSYTANASQGDQYLMINLTTDSVIDVPANAGTHVSSITASTNCSTATDVNNMLNTSVDTVVIKKNVPTADHEFLMAVKDMKQGRITLNATHLVGFVSVGSDEVLLSSGADLWAITYN